MLLANRFFGAVELHPQWATVVNGQFTLNGRACSTELWIEPALRERPVECAQAEALLSGLDELDRLARAALADEKEEVAGYFSLVVERGRKQLEARIGPGLNHEKLLADLSLTGVGVYWDQTGLRLELDYANTLPSGNAPLVVTIDGHGRIKAVERDV